MTPGENIPMFEQLEELGGSKFEIADGEPNIKGWKVVNQRGDLIGKIDELLFDAAAFKVRYLIVDLDGKALHLDINKKVLIPIGVAQINEHGDTGENHQPMIADRNDNTVRLADADYDEFRPASSRHSWQKEPHLVIVPVTVDQLIALPAYRKNHAGAEIISSVIRVFNGTGKAERAAIQQKPAAGNPQLFKEQSYEIIEYAEIPIVTKEARVTEEVELRKVVEERNEVIRETVRNTEVQAERIDAKQST